jgi:general secretion pathway protein G
MNDMLQEVSRRCPGRCVRMGGFTLIEIMVVVIIIGLLASVVVLNILPNVDKAKVTKAKEDIQSLELGLKEFYLDNSKYPTNEQGLAALVTQPTDPTIKNWKVGGYVERVSKDPWGNEYQYVFPGTHGKAYDICSLGADGQPGGDGINADICNWNLNQ